MAKRTPETITHEELVARARAAAAGSGLTQAQIAARLSVSQPLVNRALSKGETRDAAVLQSILLELAGEEWEKRVTYQRH